MLFRSTLTTQGDLAADGSALAQLEVSDALLGTADDCLLAVSYTHLLDAVVVAAGGAVEEHDLHQQHQQYRNEQTAPCLLYTS